MKSSSVHSWSSDYGLNVIEKIVWIMLNWINNVWLSNSYNRKICVNYFAPNVSSYYWNVSYDKMTSPSRTLSNLFMSQFPWENLQLEVGHINVLDLGCGKGNHFGRLQKWSNGRIVSYRGVDQKSDSNWKKIINSNENVSFVKANVIDVEDVFEMSTNFIFSQSSIEHFQYDVELFNKIHDFVCCSTKPVVQVHLLPSSSGLRLYGWHGVRQYTKRTISKLVHMYLDDSYVLLFELGGMFCNNAHNDLKRLSGRKSGVYQMFDYEKVSMSYEDLLKRAIVADAERVQKYPSFYALVIHSNSNGSVFYEH